MIHLKEWYEIKTLTRDFNTEAILFTITTKYVHTPKVGGSTSNDYQVGGFSWPIVREHSPPHIKSIQLFIVVTPLGNVRY